MAFTWTPQQIRWYENASDYGSFHRELALILAPYFEPGDTVCDWGCGLGRLSLELAPSVSRIMCVDRDSLALEALGRQLDQHAIGNITIVEASAEDCDLVCDVGLMSFFGTPYELMRRLMGQSRRLLIRIMNAGRTDGREKDAFIRDCLIREGLSFEIIEKELEFGQVLTSYEDARRYVCFHWPDRAAEGADQYLRAHLRETGSEKFPYYLTKKKKLALFLVNTSALN